MSNLLIKIPTELEPIVDEISTFTELPRDEVNHRVWQEALQLGWNVCQDAKNFGVTPHQYDSNMEALYKNGYGFIFETMVFWARPGRKHLIEITLERIQKYASQKGKTTGDLKILLLGDGTGNDSLYLGMNGCKVEYCDFPGSKTYDFVTKRFKHYGLLDNGINLIPTYEACLDNQYDVVISFDVLEHLTEPWIAIANIRSMLKTEGIALITDAYGDVTGRHPTHLESNRKFKGQSPFMFLKNGMVLTWYGSVFKPMEFTKVDKWSLRDYFILWQDKKVIVEYLSGKSGLLKQFVKKILVKK